MAHTLKYKSEEMMAVTLFVAYLTSTIGQITGFTVICNLFLAVVILFLVVKFQWVRILSLGIAVMTYGILLYLGCAKYFCVCSNADIVWNNHIKLS